MSTPPRTSPLFSVPAALLAVTALFGMGCSSSSDSLPSAHPDNPLPKCPDTPNCERVSKPYPVSAERLYARTQEALTSLKLAQLEFQSDAMRASGVDRVALFFKDDIDVAVQSFKDGSMLHVRSASRMGHSDLGVNRRRVQRILSMIAAPTSTQDASR